MSFSVAFSPGERERDRAVISSSSCSIVVVFQHRPWILMYNEYISGYSTCLQRCIQTVWVLTAVNVNNEVSIIFIETQEEVQKLLLLISVFMKMIFLCYVCLGPQSQLIMRIILPPAGSYRYFCQATVRHFSPDASALWKTGFKHRQYKLPLYCLWFKPNQLQ